LKYEDEVYTEARKEFPPVGEQLFVEGKKYRVGSLNILSRVIKLDSEDDIKIISLDEYRKIQTKNDEKRKQ
jgi:cell fate regulator YaaT (PSP1 superfamily)